jgi:hypothetical protein
MPVAASDPNGPALRPRGGSRLAGLTEGLRDFGAPAAYPITALGSLVTAAILAFLLAGRRDEFAAALSSAEAWVLAVTVLLQIGAARAQRGVAPDNPGSRRNGRTPRSLSLVEHGGAWRPG